MAIISRAKISSENEWVEFVCHYAVTSSLVITPNVLFLILVLVTVAVATPLAFAACPTYQPLGRWASENKPNAQLRRPISFLDPFSLKSYKVENTSFLSIDTQGMKSGSTAIRHRILIPSRPAVRSVFKLSLTLCSGIDSLKSY